MRTYTSLRDVCAPPAIRQAAPEPGLHMAIYSCAVKILSRGKGQSAVAAAAYRSGTSLKDERDGEIKDYTARAKSVVFTGIFAPKDAPEWVRDREELWNHAEAMEKRKDSQLAREFQLALPHEMTDQQRQWLVQDFVREQFVRRGLVADVAVHAPDREGDERNHHAHVMVTQRTVDRDGFAAIKDRSLNDREQLTEWREEWANLVNRHLARHGIEARIDHRSNADRGLEAEPTKHEGNTVTELARQGIVTDRRQENDEIRLRNAARAQQAADRALAAADVVSIDVAPAAPTPGRNEDLREDTREDLRPASTSSSGPSLDWTSRAGMVAQQASANIWARDANRAPAPRLRPQQPERDDAAPTPTPEAINRQQAAERQQQAASPVATQATEAARQGEASPTPAAAPTKSAQEAAREERLAAFDRAYAQSLQQREAEHEQGGNGRELDR